MAASLHVIGAIAEIFTWVGFGAGILLGIATLIWLIADGSWYAVRALIERDAEGLTARWFADSGVGCARLPHAHAAELGHVDAADVFAKVGRLDRVRLTGRPPGMRALGWASVALLVLSLVAGIVQVVLLFIEG